MLVEDEPAIAQHLAASLRSEGYRVVHAPTCAQGISQLAVAQPQVLILDRMLPDGDGLQVLAAARAHNHNIGVIMLTARDAVDDRVQGLRSGADDYLVKPFAYAELSARVAALLRRSPPEAQSLHYAGLALQLIERRAELKGQLLDLTQREFELLAYLVRHAGREVSRQMLSQDVWHHAKRFPALDNVIDVHIARLRRKLEAIAPNRLIHTLRGVGFCLDVDEPL